MNTPKAARPGAPEGDSSRGPSKERSGAASNGMWASLQQLTNLAFVGLFSVILARSVSVEEFGMYSYAMSLASLGIAIGLAGLSGLAMKRYAETEWPGGVTSAIILVREVTVAIYFVGLVGFAHYSTRSSDEFLLVALAGVAVFGRVLDAPELWYQARYRARTPAVIKICVALFFFTARCLALLLGAGLEFLVVLYLLEMCAASILILRAYRRDAPGGPAFELPSIRASLELWRESFPLLISGVGQQVNLRGAIIVVQVLVGAGGVAMYTVSQRIMDICVALPMAYMTATFPALLAARREDREGKIPGGYSRTMQRAFDGSVWMGIATGVVLFAFAAPIVRIAFGEDYIPASQVLQVQSISVPFLFMSAVFSKWIIAEGRLWVSVGRHWLGACINIALCFALIPEFGVIGAAWASTASYVASVYLFAFATRSTRVIALHMTRAWFAPAFLIASFMSANKKGDVEDV